MTDLEVMATLLWIVVYSLGVNVFARAAIGCGFQRDTDLHLWLAAALVVVWPFTLMFFLAYEFYCKHFPHSPRRPRDG